VLSRCKSGGKKNGVLTDVDAKSRGRPTANGLDVVEGNTVLCKSCSAAATHGLTRNICRKESAKAAKEPRAGGDGAVIS
jgi:hypothetical protein